MRSILRNLVLMSAVAVAPLATTAAMAETTLNVPFSFTVNGKVCPAGTYKVERTSADKNLVTLRSLDARNSFQWTLGPGDPAPTDDRIILSFNAEGPTHVLRSVQYGPQVTTNLDKHATMNERMTARMVQAQ